MIAITRRRLICHRPVLCLGLSGYSGRHSGRWPTTGCQRFGEWASRIHFSRTSLLHIFLRDSFAGTSFGFLRQDWLIRTAWPYSRALYECSLGAVIHNKDMRIHRPSRRPSGSD